MPAPPEYTWDFDIPNGVTARAASLADLGDAQYQNDPEEPPIPPEMMSAEDGNQWAMQLAGVNRVITGLVVEIHFTAGTPAISNATAMSSIITTTWAQANMTVTHNGPGDVSVTWAAGTMPSPRYAHQAWVTQDVACLQPIVIPNGSVGLRVKTRDNTNTLTDLDFAVRFN